MTVLSIDPIFAALDHAKEMQGNVDFEGTGTEAAAEAWNRAVQRVRRTGATTLVGVLARLDYLSGVGDEDYETARDVLRRIAAAQPGLAVA